MNSQSADAAESSGLSSGIFAETLRGTFTTRKERKLWSHFIPLWKLGQGSFGSVVAATRVADNVPVAIKTIISKRASFVEVEDGVYYPEEVSTLNELCDVKGAIGVLDCVETKDKVIIVLERPDNFIDLATYLRKQRYLNETNAKKIILQLINCINEFLEHNIIHRDLKPANILVNEKTLEIKVIDFGLISDVDSSQEILYDRMGTEVYYPPECFYQKRFYAGPGMVWVVGVIAFQLLTGCRPFLDGREIKNGPLRIPPRLSRASNSFIKSCLNRNLNSRLPLNSVANHPWLTSLSPLPSNLDSLKVKSAQVAEEESPQFSELSFYRPPKEERIDEDKSSGNSSNTRTFPGHDANEDKSGDDAMSCEEVQLSNCRATEEETYSIPASSENEVTQNTSADEVMSIEEVESPERKTDERESAEPGIKSSSSTSPEVFGNHEIIASTNSQNKNFSLKNNEPNLTHAEQINSVQQMCQFDSSTWEMIPVAIEDLEAAQILCSLRFNLQSIL